MKRCDLKSVGVVGLFLMSSLLMPGIAHAEGSFDSSISNFHTSTESRRWNDANKDSAPTQVFFRDCSPTYDVPSPYVDVATWRDILLTPDTNLGGARFDYATCFSNPGAYFGFSVGRPSAGKFYFKITAVKGAVGFNAKGVSVKW